MSGPALPALVGIAWSRVWSPVATPESFAAAWQALELPTDASVRDTAFFSTFHTGFPSPRVPLLLHAALERPGDSVRMDFLRAMTHLGVKAGEHMLPPDHLAIACEVLASALNDDEPLIVREIAGRYLRPWCDAALARLENGDVALAAVVLAFRDFLNEAQECASQLSAAQ